MPKIEKKFTIWEEFVDFRDESRNYYRETPVTASNQDTILHSLTQAIEQNDSKQFKELLLSSFIYPGDGSVDENGLFGGKAHRYVTYPYGHSYTGGNHTRRWGYEYYSVRPVVETLFFDFNALFRSLVAKVAQSSNSEIHAAFVESFKVHEVPSEILSAWDEDHCAQIRSAVSAISEYGRRKSSDEQKTARVGHAQQLAVLLTTHLERLPARANSPTSQVKWLDFKFKFIADLHSKDVYFANHLGWKRLVTNLATLIFSAGILNLINLACTGNFLFFKQTKTQSMVSDMDIQVHPEDYDAPLVSNEPPKDCRGKDYYSEHENLFYNYGFI